MRLGIDDLPIERVISINNTLLDRGVWVVWLVAIALADQLIWLLYHRVNVHPRADLFVFLIIPAIIAGTLITVLGRASRKCLKIDDRGVHMDKEGVIRNFLWSDIWLVDKAPIRRRGRVTGAACVYIRVYKDLSPEHYVNPNAINVIGPEFGLDIDDVVEVIRAGKARWGPRD
jgi:hypothetical protein